MSVSDLIEDLLLAEIRAPSPGIARAESHVGKGYSPNSPNSPANPAAHRHWWIHFPDREPLEIVFAPGQTYAEVLALYQAAVAAEYLPDVLPEPVTPEPEPLVPDDRRTCRQCANLTAVGRCVAAAHGELPNIPSRRYSPMPDQPQRCESYAPGPDDADQRTGRERWLGLIPGVGCNDRPSR